ncbi:hypothetical protein DPMN_061545 [Dreissena polymorpha]|uniref:Uncharacterized protein n=1 Tax=Dreissena polymorpha TaxID=45954 RepID=A0A9D4C7W3_DREPO|nr:hypothetical protein DPMN_061454 [Dreissena polymorpha]KAH3718739.1 hypothetical protein DPMN_061545 [Dreissena polymorpha]
MLIGCSDDKRSLEYGLFFASMYEGATHLMPLLVLGEAARLIAIEARFSNQIRRIIGTPGRAEAITSRVARAFRPGPQSTAEQRRTGRGTGRGRRPETFNVLMQLIRDPARTTLRGIAWRQLSSGAEYGKLQT